MMSVEEKLKVEMDALVQEYPASMCETMQSQFNVISSIILEKAQSDFEYAKKICDDKKTFANCIKYMSKKAMHLRVPTENEKNKARSGEPIVVAVVDDLVSMWVYEYYIQDIEETVTKVEKQKKTKLITKPKKGLLKGQLSILDI